MSKKNHKPLSNYILLQPDKPNAGSFHVEQYINETATVLAVGPAVTESTKKLVGKRVIFNAWACDEKTIEGEKLYFAPEDANALCAIL